MRRNITIFLSSVLGFLLVFGFQNCAPHQLVTLKEDGKIHKIDGSVQIMGKVQCDSESPYYGKTPMALQYCMDYLVLAGTDRLYLEELKQFDIDTYIELLNSECLISQTSCQLAKAIID